MDNLTTVIASAIYDLVKGLTPRERKQVRKIVRLLLLMENPERLLPEPKLADALPPKTPPGEFLGELESYLPLKWERGFSQHVCKLSPAQWDALINPATPWEFEYDIKAPFPLNPPPKFLHVDFGLGKDRTVIALIDPVNNTIIPLDDPPPTKPPKE